ncbi:hypothetical protein HMPREF1979_02387 [Actinomyces johnsonii F0542]|uniref:Uncharacterized protein n=2 Tax=Actinomyces johnsonii TaxID=544581 RepID=U1QLE3_9ACTO|nr:hypothetical protein HMPREF1549_02533 [Actinomyces johnsonii F0510]ERH22614.1 hypothetical protein HMPREF1979_02387 [Actinomyces johnsonii F0542]
MNVQGIRGCPRTTRGNLHMAIKAISGAGNTMFPAPPVTSTGK